MDTLYLSHKVNSRYVATDRGAAGGWDVVLGRSGTRAAGDRVALVGDSDVAAVGWQSEWPG